MWDQDLLKKYRMISFDRPGFGFSGYGNALHLQEQCRLLLPVIQALKNGRPMTLHGHSFGGPVAAKLAADDPSLFKTIIIDAGAIDPALETKETWRRIVARRPFYWFVPGVYQTSNTELLYLKKDLVPLAADLDNIRCKVLFIHGSKDTWVPIENIAYGSRMMVNAESISADTLPGADHQIPWKRTAQFKKILLDLP
jgi:pimeloyl-ACP methyl ester carboxylesterase